MSGVEREGGWGEGKGLNPSLIGSSLNHIFMSKEVINQPLVFSPQVLSTNALLKSSLQVTLLAVRVVSHPAVGPRLSETRKQGPDAAWPSQVLRVCGDLAVTASYRTSGLSFFFPFLLGHVLLGGCLCISVPGLCGEGTFQPEAEVICGPQGN